MSASEKDTRNGIGGEIGGIAEDILERGEIPQLERKNSQTLTAFVGSCGINPAQKSGQTLHNV